MNSDPTKLKTAVGLTQRHSNISFRVKRQTHKLTDGQACCKTRNACRLKKQSRDNRLKQS